MRSCQLSVHSAAKYIHCRFKSAKGAARQSYDFAIWLLAARLSDHDFRTRPATAKQLGLLQNALHKWMAASEDQLLSQLLLQLLLLAQCIPEAKALQEGTPEACAFVSKLVAATDKTAQRTPSELVLAEVQLSFVLTSAQRISILSIQFAATEYTSSASAVRERGQLKCVLQLKLACAITHVRMCHKMTRQEAIVAHTATLFAGAFMCAKPAPAMLQAATSAGLLTLLHKLLNCTGAKPLVLGADVRAHATAASDDEATARLLRGAQKCAPLPCAAALAVDLAGAHLTQSVALCSGIHTPTGQQNSDVQSS